MQEAKRWGLAFFSSEKEKLPFSLPLTLRYYFQIFRVRSVGNTPPFHAMNRSFLLKLHGSPATGILKPKCQCHWAKSLSNQFVTRPVETWLSSHKYKKFEFLLYHPRLGALRVSMGWIPFSSLCLPRTG